MAEQFASGQMFHLQNKLRMAPLNIVRPRVLQHIPRGRETVHLSEKPVSIITGKRANVLERRHSLPDSHRLERQRCDRPGTIESFPQRQLHSEA